MISQSGQHPKLHGNNLKSGDTHFVNIVELLNDMDSDFELKTGGSVMYVLYSYVCVLLCVYGVVLGCVL